MDDEIRGLGEREKTPGGGVTVGDAVPEMPAGWAGNGNEDGGGLTAGDTAQPTPSGDPTGDRATGLIGMHGG